VIIADKATLNRRGGGNRSKKETFPFEKRAMPADQESPVIRSREVSVFSQKREQMLETVWCLWCGGWDSYKPRTGYGAQRELAVMEGDGVTGW